MVDGERDLLALKVLCVELRALDGDLEVVPVLGARRPAHGPAGPGHGGRGVREAEVEVEVRRAGAAARGEQVADALDADAHDLGADVGERDLLLGHAPLAAELGGLGLGGVVAGLLQELLLGLELPRLAEEQDGFAFVGCFQLHGVNLGGVDLNG